MVIDELVVTLGLDPKNFTAGQREALAAFKKTKEEAVATAKDVEQQGKRVTDFFGKLKREAIGLVGAFFGGRGVKEFVSYITAADANVGRFSKTLNVSAETLSTWQGVARQTGGSAESITGAMQGLSGQIQHFLDTGQGSFLPLLDAMRVDLKNANGELKTMDQLFLDLAAASEKLDPARARSRLAGLGLNEQSINMLLLGEKKLRDLLETTRKLGPATKESAEGATKLQEAWAALELRAEGLGRTIYQKLTPFLTGLANVGGGLLSGLGDLGTLLWGSPEEIAAMRKKHADAKSAKGGASKGPATGATDPTAPLRYKFGANAAGSSHAGVGALAHDLQSEIPSLDRFTAFNDLYHAFLGRDSAHKKGLALDLTLKDPAQSKSVAAQIRAKLAARGIDAKVIDEYLNPSKGSTGGHIHVQFADVGAAEKYAGAGVRAGAGLAASSVDNSRSSSSQSSSTTTVGTINITVPNGDATAIAGGIKGALSRSDIGDAANTGLQ